MAPTQAQPALALLERSDDRYLRFTDEDRATVLRALPSTGFRGLAVAGPRALPAAAGSALPVLVARQCSELRDWESNFGLNAVLAVVALDSGVVHVLPFEHDEKASGAAGGRGAAPEDDLGPPPPDAADSLVTDVKAADLRQRLRLGDPPVRLSVSVHWDDWASNTAVVGLVPAGGAAAPPSQGSLRFDDLRAAVGDLRAAERHGRARAVLRGVDSPEPLVAFELPAEWRPADGVLPLRGTVAVPLGTAQVVAPSDAEVARSSGLPPAIARGAVVLVHGRTARRYVFPLELHADSDQAAAPGQVLGFEFELDLRLALTGIPAPGTYHGFVVAGELRSATATMVVHGVD